jgi:HSP20 family protein
MPMYRPVSRTGIAYPLDELRDELDRLWTSLTAAPPLHGWGARTGSDVFPAVNVSESDECITVEAELPGLDAGEVDIAVSGEELTLKGTRPEPQLPAKPATAGAGPGNGERQKALTWHRRERGTGSFERRITLPTAVDASRVEANLVDGVLTVTCPKAPERQPHKVAVRAG